MLKSDTLSIKKQAEFQKLSKNDYSTNQKRIKGV